MKYILEYLKSFFITINNVPENNTKSLWYFVDYIRFEEFIVNLCIKLKDINTDHTLEIYNINGELINVIFFNCQHTDPIELSKHLYACLFDVICEYINGTGESIFKVRYSILVDGTKI
jgi:hypothetical protein